ncbi:hypothetical protein OG342_14935 [Streptomyces bobili]|uniref:hypothetical protein n=1 Tax=Streptomyces bobili TaxID=67280 RepID=UPI00224D6DCA|nr:hypothetical protein [Streptomyces bobili]MCX5524150.1 hypothetical protein [Streptomyces bobili]
MATNDDELDREAEKVYNLWKQGVNRKAIGRRYGMSLDVVNRRLSRARKNLGEDALADMRTDTESSLDDLIRASHRNLKSAETVAERNSIIRTIADLKMKKSKLLGLEMPAKVTLEMEKALELLHFQGEAGWGDE